MSTQLLHDLIKPVADFIAGETLTPALADKLNTQFPHNGEWYQALLSICTRGTEEGWICQHEAGGIRYGRVIKPSADLHDLSVDIVLMKDVVGPHHAHPNGEIDLILPLTEGAAFDGTREGWKVYPPGSAHKPTVTGGEAFVLYLLPEGAIEFSRN